MADQPEPRSLSEILDAVRALGGERDTVSVDDVVNELGRASTAALLFVPAITATTPLSGIPGLSALCGIMIAVVSAQAVVGRHCLWLPRFITRRTVEGTRIHDSLDKVRPITTFLDRHTHERFHLLVRGPGTRALFALCMMGGMVMPFLEFIPFSASAVAACITLLTIAILTLDGLVALAGLCLVVAAGGLLAWLI
ncbi:exopolysaccharide biosynthesis protein [Anianabacter salinae]|uniref:exopolysaccharide biosynthesis protein n=1 Tax=Anianabacter salinae TaxID=2851023 RepID=UPI00225E6B23|nr:exopolysaccharide biosynthesis protein [Anianabacter salinae]MBV0911196.1 exopolysaccharide biosynthesis protein [Anianabacter salinae]